MLERYKTVYEGGQGEIVEKKSRFIANVRPVKSEEEAQAFIEEMKKKYWDARHNCSAYVIGEHREYTRCSDDGEPSQTAGRPMLDVLLGEDLYDTAVVVLCWVPADWCAHIQKPFRKDWLIAAS